jgi:PilZ domain
MELRNRIRYRVEADAVFAWEGVRRDRFSGHGVTRDIGLGGAFVFTATCPPVGSTVEIDIILVPAQGSSRKTVHIKTEATVTRIDRSSTPEGFAATSQSFKLLFTSNRKKTFSISSERSLLGSVAGD